MARYITVAQLKRAGACDGQVGKFRELFGRNGKVKVTESNAIALSTAFPITWAVYNLLTDAQLQVYNYKLPAALARFDATEVLFTRARERRRL
jgi:hypothetical protein